MKRPKAILNAEHEQAVKYHYPDQRFHIAAMAGVTKHLAQLVESQLVPQLVQRPARAPNQTERL